MDNILNKIFTNDINIYELADQYFNIRTPFTGLDHNEVTYESWQYAIKHLPASIFISNFNTIKYILHLPGDHYSNFNKNSNEYTFEGWLRPRHQGIDIYNGQYIKCESRVISNKHCEIHINLRDIYTDACEFISNLMLHIIFMKINQNDEIIVYKKGKCNNYTKCGAVLKSKRNIINENNIIHRVNLSKNKPNYDVKFNSLNFSLAKMHISNKIDNIYEKILEKTIEFCECENFKVHIIQGASSQLGLMTTNHPTYDLSDVEITNNYGGKYKDYDEYIAKLHKYGKKKLWNDINVLNSKFYKYINVNGLSFTFILLNKIVKSPSMDEVFRILIDNLKNEDNHIILNIPYSFGSESYYIAQSMLKYFGNRLASFQVIGKAGGIGNIKLNDYVIANKLSIAYPEIFNNMYSDISISTDGIYKSLKSGEGVTVYRSGVKIMPCVLFEEKNYLENIEYKYSAIEMEGYWYLSVFNDIIPSIYLYYISDLPLKQSLAHEVFPRDEGQMLFNGLIRMGFTWLIEKFNKNNIYNIKDLINISGGKYFDNNIFNKIINKKKYLITKNYYVYFNNILNNCLLLKIYNKKDGKEYADLKINYFLQKENKYIIKFKFIELNTTNKYKITGKLSKNINNTYKLYKIYKPNNISTNNNDLKNYKILFRVINHVINSL